MASFFELKKRYWAQVNSGGLPSGYRRVEYLEGTGTQYIRAITGEVDGTYGLDAVFSCGYLANNYPAGFSTTNNRRFLFWGPYVYWRYGWYTQSTPATQPSYELSDYPNTLDDYYHATLNWLNGGTCSFADNPEASIQGYGESFTNTDFLLFASYLTPVKARFKSARISQGADIVRDFVPCVRIADGKPGLYDLCGSICPLTGTPFYVNAGTGEFTTP